MNELTEIMEAWNMEEDWKDRKSEEKMVIAKGG
jgi:hypothetical protein